eukprot:CAMPEP_0185701110 /NCGR_PEP_ID=MMETSP1164-20130828/8558_1 /TAXON_ID=1104430 /ORGANISM="Chrysoreinhardia sp, Strain CCMP2950" /LENGTH=197 /DNA_ID=CAMNT_0028368103 /DNA_START=16 /DNA_END=605 /DNA_ORIENTATION=+
MTASRRRERKTTKRGDTLGSSHGAWTMSCNERDLACASCTAVGIGPRRRRKDELLRRRRVEEHGRVGPERDDAVAEHLKHEDGRDEREVEAEDGRDEAAEEAEEGLRHDEDRLQQRNVHRLREPREEDARRDDGVVDREEVDRATDGDDFGHRVARNDGVELCGLDVALAASRAADMMTRAPTPCARAGRSRGCGSR